MHQVKYIDRKGRIKVVNKKSLNDLSHIKRQLVHNELPYMVSYAIAGSAFPYGYNESFTYNTHLIEEHDIEELDNFFRVQQQRVLIINLAKSKTNQYYYIDIKYKTLTCNKNDIRLTAIQAYNLFKDKIPFTDGITYFGFDEKLNFGLINNTENNLPNWLEKQYSLYQVYSLSVVIGD